MRIHHGPYSRPMATSRPSSIASGIERNESWSVVHAAQEQHARRSGGKLAQRESAAATAGGQFLATSASCSWSSFQTPYFS